MMTLYLTFEALNQGRLADEEETVGNAFAALQHRAEQCLKFLVGH